MDDPLLDFIVFDQFFNDGELTSDINRSSRRRSSGRGSGNDNPKGCTTLCIILLIVFVAIGCFVSC